MGVHVLCGGFALPERVLYIGPFFLFGCAPQGKGIRVGPHQGGWVDPQGPPPPYPMLYNFVPI